MLVPPLGTGGRGLSLRGSVLALLQLHSYILSWRPSSQRNVSIWSQFHLFRPRSGYPEARMLCPNGCEPTSRAYVGFSPRSSDMYSWTCGVAKKWQFCKGKSGRVGWSAHGVWGLTGCGKRSGEGCSVRKPAVPVLARNSEKSQNSKSKPSLPSCIESIFSR